MNPRFAFFPIVVSLFAPGCATDPQTPTDVHVAASEPLVDGESAGCFSDHGGTKERIVSQRYAVGARLFLSYQFQRGCGGSMVSSGERCEPLRDEKVVPLDPSIWDVKLGVDAPHDGVGNGDKDLLLTALKDGKAGVAFTANGETFRLELEVASIEEIELRELDPKAKHFAPLGAVETITLAPSETKELGIVPVDKDGHRLCGLLPVAAKASSGVTVTTAATRTNAKVAIRASDAPGPRSESVVFLQGMRVRRVAIEVR